MQMGPSHDPVSWTSGVWPLRILISSCLGFSRFIVLDDLRDLHETVDVKMPVASIDAQCTPRTSRSRVCFAVRSGCASKNGTIVPTRSARRFTTNWPRCSRWLSCRVRDKSAHAEEASRSSSRQRQLCTLRHDKPMRHLIPGFVASAIRRDMAAGRTRWRSIPLRLQSPVTQASSLNQSFLLIVRTRHIVTVPPTSDGTRSAGYSDVPAYSRVLQLPRSTL